MATFAICSSDEQYIPFGVERYCFRQHDQSSNPDEREKFIAIHNFLLDHCRRAVCASRKAKNSQYKMSVRPM